MSGREREVPFLSVVIPAYNEESRLDGFLRDVVGYLDRAPHSWEVLVVDDGSRDGTAAIAREWANRHPALSLITLPVNRGKGHAVKAGMLKASGRFRIFVDADGATAMGEFDRFRPTLERGASVVIGVRRGKGARVLKAQPWHRRALSRGFILLCRALLLPGIKDFTCGFKCFSAKAAEDVFSRLRIERWAFDAEALFLADRLGYPIVQVPITWSDARGSRVRLLRDILGSLRDLLRIRGNSLMGRYLGPSARASSPIRPSSSAVSS